MGHGLIDVMYGFISIAAFAVGAAIAQLEARLQAVRVEHTPQQPRRED